MIVVQGVTVNYLGLPLSTSFMYKIKTKYCFNYALNNGCLELMSQKVGVGAYTDMPFVCITHIYVNHRIIKKGGWALTRRWVLTRENTVPCSTLECVHIKLTCYCTINSYVWSETFLTV